MSTEANFVLNWGIVGSGNIANDFCTSVLSLRSNLHVLQSVAALTLNEASDFAKKYNIKNKYDSFDDIYKDSDVNIIYVATINKTHKDICLKAINAGKHVLCEKPMCLNSIEQEEIFTAAKQKGVFFMEALWIRFTPQMEAIQREVERNLIGGLKFFVGNFMHDYMHVERMRNKENGGGVLLDMGIYMVQFACLLFNHEKPIKIVATGGLMSTGVDEFETISLIFEGHRMATLNISCNCGREDSSVLVGPKGYLRITNMLTSVCRLEYSTGEKLEVFPPDNEEFKFRYFNRVCLRYQAEECRVAIAKGLLESPKATHDMCRVIMSIMDEARKQLGYKFDNE